MSERLNKQSLHKACRKLAETEPGLKMILETYGPPPLWAREESFATLIRIILEQQVSLASARSAFDKLKQRVGEITPENVLQLSDREMKACYFSRQKTGYARNLAEAVLEEKLVLKDLRKLSDEKVRAELMKIKGIGVWTADIYLLMVLLRPDVMPKGDVALHVGYKEIKNLNKRPGSDEFIEMTQEWKPFRSVAARLLWHFYLEKRKPSGIN